MRVPLMSTRLVVLQAFDWTSPTGQTVISWPISEMLHDITRGTLKVEKIRTVIEPDLADNWIAKRIDNWNYVETMSLAQRNVPVLGAWMPPTPWQPEAPSVLLIDGSHRYMARYRRNEMEIDYHIVAIDDWRRYAKITGTWPPT